MKKAIIVFLLASIQMVAQVKESRRVSDFNQVKVSQGIELNYNVAKDIKVTVETDNKELMQYVKTEVKDKVLNVYIDSGKTFFGKSQKFKTLKVNVEGPDLKGVKVSSSAKFIAKEALKADDFTLEVSSSGYFKGNVKTNSCRMSVSSSGKIKSDIQASGIVDLKSSSSASFSGAVSAKELQLATSSSSDMELSGDVKKVKAESSSSSSIDAAKLKTRELDVTASSSSSSAFFVSERINASAASSAKISYYGNPTEVNVKKSSSGKVIKG